MCVGSIVGVGRYLSYKSKLVYAEHGPLPGTNCKETHVIFVAATGGPIHRRDGIVLGRSKCQKWILRKKLIVLACKHSI